MSNTELAAIVVPAVIAAAVAVWVFVVRRAGSRPGYTGRLGASRPWHDVISGTFRGPGAIELTPLPERDRWLAPDRREPDIRELEESGTDYVDFGAPERVRRS